MNVNVSFQTVSIVWKKCVQMKVTGEFIILFY